MTRALLTLVMLISWLWLAGCASSPAAPSADTPAATADTPRATLPPTPLATPLPTTFAGGQNEDGTYFRGHADAPITLVEYSDFL